jgi:uncharacterized protein
MTTKLGSYLLVPAQLTAWKNKQKLNEKRQNLSRNYNTKEINVITQDNIQLNAMIFKHPTNFFSFFKSKKILIRFGGQNENYENHNGYIAKAHKLGYDLLLFNYRGVGKSNGSPSPEGLIKDGRAAIDYALSLGYNPKNIIVHGFSLGGAIATKTLASDQEHYQKVKFINDRSFSSVKAVINNFTILGFFKFILSSLLNIFNWNIDVVNDWKKLKNSKLILVSDTDDFIPYKGSLAYAIGRDSCERVNVLKNYSHVKSLSENEMQFFISKV